MAEKGKWITYQHKHIFIPEGKTFEDIFDPDYAEDIDLPDDGYVNIKSKKLLEALKQPEGSTNCQKCVLAYLMNKLYNKNYKPTKYRPGWINDNSDDLNNIKGKYNIWNMIHYTSYYQTNITSSMITNMLSKYPNQIFAISISWAPPYYDNKGKKHFSSHIFVAEVDSKGNVDYIDPQAGDSNVNKYFRLAERKDKDATMKIGRVDNINFDKYSDIIQGGNYFEK